jgi:hypothetical protein
MILLNVLVFAAAGLLGSAFLLQTLHRLTSVFGTPLDPAASSAGQEAGPLELEKVPGQIFGNRARTIFQAWVLVFGLVGAQMAWVLRPFIGNPAQPFTWFRAPTSNFFEALVAVIRAVIQ